MSALWLPSGLETFGMAEVGVAVIMVSVDTGAMQSQGSASGLSRTRLYNGSIDGSRLQARARPFTLDKEASYT